MDDLEPITIADIDKTPLDKLVEPTIVNLKQLGKQVGDDHDVFNALEHVPETPIKDIGAVATPGEGRSRDEHGKFAPNVGDAVPAVEAKPAVKAEPTADDDDETKAPTSVSQFEKRLAKERWKRGELERRYDEMLQRVETLLAQRPELTARAEPAKAPTSAVFPGYDDYLTTHPDVSYEEYLDARAEAKIDARFTVDRQRLEADSRVRSVQSALHTISTLGAKTHADFEASVQAAFDVGLRWAPHVTQFVTAQTESAEEAVALTYALAKDHALLTRINGLPPARATYELGRLAASLPSAAGAASSAQPMAPPVTRAGDPITPVGTSAAASPLTPESLVKGTSVNLKRLAAAVGR